MGFDKFQFSLLAKLGLLLAVSACTSMGGQGSVGGGPLSAPSSSTAGPAGDGSTASGEQGSSAEGLVNFTQNAAAPSQSSGAPNPNLDPEDLIQLYAKLQSAPFHSSPSNGYGMVAVKLSGKIDVTEANKAIQANPFGGEPINLSGRFVRFIDFSSGNFMQTSLEEIAPEQYGFEIVYLMTPERFEQLKDEFDLLLKLAPFPVRWLKSGLFPEACPNESVFPGCGVGHWHTLKVQWTPMAMAAEENLNSQ
jgi:hypothetical protein